MPSDSAGEAEQPRPQRSREGSRDGSRGGRKPRREREPRPARAAESPEREPRPARDADKSGEREPRRARGRSAGPQPAAAAFTPPAPAQPSRVPSIGRPEPSRAQREADSEPADHSHLPAFLLRPVRARV